MGEHCKVTTLTQEVIRRMRNISREASWEERSEVLTKFAVKMYVSKYREEKRREILVAGLKGYEKQLDLNDRGIKKLYRRQWEGKASRAWTKLTGKSDWFMRKPEEGSLLAGGENNSSRSTPPEECRGHVQGGAGARGTTQGGKKEEGEDGYEDEDVVEYIE